MKEKTTKVKSKIRDKSKLIGIAALCLALITAIILFAGTFVKAGDTVDVVIAKNDIACGKQITAEDIETLTVSAYNLNDQVARNTENVIGKYAAFDLKAGEYMFSSKLSGSALGTDTQLANLQDGQVAVSFTVDSLAAGLANKLQAGDIIRIYSYDQLGGVQDHPALAYVKVLSVSDTAGIEVNGAAGSTSTYAAITVAAAPEQAKQIILLENTGTVYTSFITRNAETAAQLLAKQAEMLG